jgi:hypothetical protein
MKALIALEELIKQDENHIKLAKKQLAAHESGENKMTPLVKASTESSLQLSQERLERSQAKLQELLKHDLAELEKEERIREAVVRKNYFHYQKARITRGKKHSNDVKLEAMSIIDELPEDKDVGIEDQTLYDIAEKSVKMQLSLHEEMENTFREIKTRLDDLLSDKSIEEEDIDQLVLLNEQIVIVTLHLKVLIENIEEIIEEDENMEPFKGLPKYEDWWIKELWTNHQAYMGLYKWRQIVASLCLTTMQREAWDIIFAKWVNIKKYLNTKGELAYKYTFAFDTLIREFCGLEEELSKESLESMENIIAKLTSAENFAKQSDSHELITEYAKFKIEKLSSKPKKSK